MNVSLKELIETGRFGSASLGVSRAQVATSLGAPDEVGEASRKFPQPSIWKYGDVELHFEAGADILSMIYMDDFDVPGKLVNFDPWLIRRTLTLSDAEEQSSQSGIEYEVEDYELEDDAKCLTAGVGVKLIFIGKGLLLRVVSYTPRGLTTACSGPRASRPLIIGGSSRPLMPGVGHLISNAGSRPYDDACTYHLFCSARTHLLCSHIAWSSHYFCVCLGSLLCYRRQYGAIPGSDSRLNW